MNFIDENGVTDFVDQNGVTLFVDQNGIFLGTTGGAQPSQADVVGVASCDW